MNCLMNWFKDLPNRLRAWEKRHYVRVRARRLSRHVFVEGRPEWGSLDVHPTGAQGSGISRSMWEGSYLIHVNEDHTDLQVGEQVQVA